MKLLKFSQSQYTSYVTDLIARMPLATLQVRRILVDDQKKPSVLARDIRIAVSPVLRARNIERAPKVRGEPSHQCDGLQVADMLAGAIVAREKTRNDYARRLDRLVVYRYEAQQ